MKKILILSLIIIVLLSCVYAVEYSNYPIAELGNCGNQQDCEVYCDVSSNIESCVTFAEKNNLMTPEEIAEARKLLPYLISGTTPGACKNQAECDAYCEDEAHINECVDFAVKAGLMDAGEAEMAKKTGGKGPGNCKKEIEKSWERFT